MNHHPLITPIIVQIVKRKRHYSQTPVWFLAGEKIFAWIKTIIIRVQLATNHLLFFLRRCLFAEVGFNLLPISKIHFLQRAEWRRWSQWSSLLSTYHRFAKVFIWLIDYLTFTFSGFWLQILRAILNKKIHPQGSSSTMVIKKYLKDKQMAESDNDEDEFNTEADNGIKWVKTDSECESLNFYIHV